MGLTAKPYGKIKSGKILYEGKNLLEMDKKQLRRIRGEHISMIFQDPMTSLNPVMTVGDQIAEAIRNHDKLSRKDAAKKAAEILELVGIPSARGSEYPHQFSGGQRQRIGIARAIRDLRERFRTSMLLITHDLGVIAQNCDYVSVIYAGEIVETGTVHDIFRNKLHPYTAGLFSSIPNINEDVERLVPIEGLMPDPTDLPVGCAFCDRCCFATEQCRTEHPHLVNMGGEEGNHQVRCLRYKETREEGE